MQNQSMQEPELQPEVQQALNRLDASLAGVLLYLSELEARTLFVRNVHINNASGIQCSPTPYRSELADRIHAEIRAADEIQERIKQLIEELEI